MVIDPLSIFKSLVAAVIQWANFFVFDLGLPILFAIHNAVPDEWEIFILVLSFASTTLAGMFVGLRQNWRDWLNL